MQNGLEQQIAEQRAAIAKLDNALDNQRTPYLKSRLKFATNMLDDAEQVQRLIESGKYGPTMCRFVAQSIQIATQMHDEVRDRVNKYGGPEHVLEAGG